MSIFINVRGCNGSGKTFLLRQLGMNPEARVDHITVWHNVKNKVTGEKEYKAHPPIPVTRIPGGIAILGDYTPAAAGCTTAGCDRIKTQEATKEALQHIALDPKVEFILFEGIVVSTIYGPWQEWGQSQAETLVWAFLDTPLDVCLARIQKRNGGKPVKEDQVADKHRTIERVMYKAKADDEYCAILRYEHSFDDLLNMMANFT